MIRNLGFYNTSGTRTHVRFMFSTHAAAGGNVAPLSAFEAADIRIYKAADSAAFSATQRSSTSGFTVTSPFDSLTGVHDVDIDLTDNTDAGFFASGCRYSVVLAPDTETVDSQTITGVVLGEFEIGVAKADVTQLLGTAWLTPGTAGTPDVNAKLLGGTSQTGRDIGASVLLSTGTGTGQVNLSSGKAPATIAAGDLAADSITSSALASSAVTEIRDAITGGAYALSTDSNGRVRIVDGTAAGELDTSSGLVTLAGTQTFNNTGTWTGNITGNLSGSAGSVTGAVGSVTAGVTVSTNNDKTGYSLSVTPPTAAQNATAVWTDLLAGSDFSTVASIGKLLKDDIDAAISSRGTGTALDAAGVRSAIGLAAANLDTQLAALPTATAIRNAVTGGAYALDTDANGRIRIVDGTGAGELDTASGLVSVVASSVRSAVGLASANLDTQLDALPTANENADALLDRTDGVETGVTLRQSQRAMAAVLCGKIADAGTGTETYKSIGGTTTRVTATIDASGNRSVMLLSL